MHGFCHKPRTPLAAPIDFLASLPLFHTCSGLIRDGCIVFVQPHLAFLSLVFVLVFFLRRVLILYAHAH